jgi:hypothetical protein
VGGASCLYALTRVKLLSARCPARSSRLHVRRGLVERCNMRRGCAAMSWAQFHWSGLLLMLSG